MTPSIDSLKRVCGRLWPPQDLLEHGEALCFPAPKDRVRHAIRLEPEEELEVFRRERHAHLHVVLLGAGRHGILVAGIAAMLHVPLVGGPEVPVLIVAVLELVQLLPEGIHLRRARPAELVEEDVTLPEPVALAVSEGDEFLLRVVDLLEDGPLGGEVGRADRRGPLVDDVLQEVRDAVESGPLQHRSDPIPEVRGHPGRPVVFDDEDRKAVVERVLLDRERPGAGLGGEGERRHVRRRLRFWPRCGGRRRQGGERGGEDDDEQGSHFAVAPSSR